MHLTQHSRNSGCDSKTNDGCLLTDHMATHAAAAWTTPTDSAIGLWAYTVVSKSIQ